MIKTVKLFAIVAVIAAISGCSTTNSIPYKASTSNVIFIQNTFQSKGVKVSVGSFSMGAGVEENLLCRLMGPVTVAPGKGLSTYIKEALQEELFQFEQLCWLHNFYQVQLQHKFRCVLCLQKCSRCIFTSSAGID